MDSRPSTRLRPLLWLALSLSALLAPPARADLGVVAEYRDREMGLPGDFDGVVAEGLFVAFNEKKGLVAYDLEAHKRRWSRPSSQPRCGQEPTVRALRFLSAGGGRIRGVASLSTTLCDAKGSKSLEDRLALALVELDPASGALAQQPLLQRTVRIGGPANDKVSLDLEQAAQDGERVVVAYKTRRWKPTADEVTPRVLTFDLAAGRLLWDVAVEKGWNGARSLLTLADGLALVSRPGGLVALEGQSGEARWTFPAAKGAPYLQDLGDGRLVFVNEARILHRVNPAKGLEPVGQLPEDLSGLRVIGGRLFGVTGEGKSLLALDPDSLQETGRVPLPKASWSLAVWREKLLVFVGEELWVVDPQTLAKVQTWQPPWGWSASGGRSFSAGDDLVLVHSVGSAEYYPTQLRDLPTGTLRFSGLPRAGSLFVDGRLVKPKAGGSGPAGASGPVEVTVTAGPHRVAVLSPAGRPLALEVIGESGRVVEAPLPPPEPLPVRPAAATTPFAEAEIAKMRLQKIQPQDFTWANAGPSGNGGIGNWHDVQIVEGTGYAVARKRVLAVDPLTNKLLWTWDRIAAADALPERARDPSRSQNLLAILPEERLLLLEVEVGFTLIALDLDDGHLRWAQPHAGFLSSVAVAGGVLYHYTAGGLGPRVVARDLRDGRLLADGAIPVPKPNGFDVRCRVALVDDTLFFGSGETSFAVHGLNRFTLAPAFKSVAMPAEVWTLFPAVSPGKKGVVAMAGRQAYKVGLDGKATKGAALQGELARTPPFDDDRALYLSRYYTTLSFAISKDTAGLLWTHKGTGKYAELQGVLPGGFAIGSEEGEGGTRVVVVRTKDGQVLWREPEKPEGGRDDRLAGPIYGAAFVGGKLVLAGERGFYLLAE